MYKYHNTRTLYTCTLYINYLNGKWSRTFSREDIYLLLFVTYTVYMNWLGICWLVALVRILTQKLVFIRLHVSGGFAKALVHGPVYMYVHVDADEFHC